MKSSNHAGDLRCGCSRSPLLAKYGTDKQGAWIWIKSYRQGRVFTEAVLRGGSVSLICRECLRWTKITMRPGAPPEDSVSMETVDQDQSATLNSQESPQ